MAKTTMLVTAALFAALAGLLLSSCGGLFQAGTERTPTANGGSTGKTATPAPISEPDAVTPIPTAFTTPSPAATSIPVPPTILTETLTYTDTVIGYAIDYPASWHISSRPGWLVSLTSFDPQAVGPRGGITPEQCKIDLAPDKMGQTKTLEELAAEAKAGDGSVPVQVLREEQWRLAEDIPAIRLDTEWDSLPKTAILLAVINGRSLRLAGYGDLSLFDAIAHTLRPVPIPAVIISIGEDEEQ